MKKSVKKRAFLITSIGFLYLITMTGCGPSPSEKFFTDEGKGVGEAVGEVLMQRQQNIRVIIMTRPGLKYAPLKPSEEALVRGISKVLKSKVQTAEIIPGSDFKLQKNGDSKKEEHSSYSFQYQQYGSAIPSKDFMSFLERHKSDADVVVNMLGFPKYFKAEDYPSDTGLPDLVFINASVPESIRLLQNGKSWIFHTIRPEKELPDFPGISIENIGHHSLLLYPSPYPSRL